jgi:hypothetical protein
LRFVAFWAANGTKASENAAGSRRASEWCRDPVIY